MFPRHTYEVVSCLPFINSVSRTRLDSLQNSRSTNEESWFVCVCIPFQPSRSDQQPSKLDPTSLQRRVRAHLRLYGHTSWQEDHSQTVQDNYPGYASSRRGPYMLQAGAGHYGIIDHQLDCPSQYRLAPLRNLFECHRLRSQSDNRARSDQQNVRSTKTEPNYADYLRTLQEHGGIRSRNNPSGTTFFFPGIYLLRIRHLGKCSTLALLFFLLLLLRTVLATHLKSL